DGPVAVAAGGEPGRGAGGLPDHSPLRPAHTGHCGQSGGQSLLSGRTHLGHAGAGTGPGAHSIPETIQAVLASRIDRLPPEAKRLLQTAAVLGTEVPVPLLHAIAERPGEAVEQSLARLQAGEFLTETRLVPERVYTFRHVLTQEVAYGSLLQERLRALHATI